MEVKKGFYRHFKGESYEVLRVARDCENPERKLVIYVALYEDPEFGGRQTWAREISDFLGEKTFSEDTEINGKMFGAGTKIKRFELVSEKNGSEN